ncbi:MAG: tetratricopeptide repeat protein [Gammaproteobacteria bacterium]|nr:tetratricopeptide repeat protein [Gammaproteobacteria bacterium]
MRTLIGVMLLFWTAMSHGAAADVQALIAGGRLEEALSRVDSDLAADKSDVTLQFLKGLVLTRLNRLDHAAEIFQQITDEHPDLPEPYNNLAVVHAARGDFEAAQQALRKAINTHPSYATAHENLGDIYAKMASQAYNQALELDEGNSTAKAKLALIGDLFSMPDPMGGAAAATEVAATRPRPEPRKEAPDTPARPEPVGPQRPEPAPSAPAIAETAAVATAQPEVMPATETQSTDATASPPAPSSADEIRSAVEAWAAAWSARNADGYLAAYSTEFMPPDGATRDDWEQARRERITRPRYIKVTMSGMNIVEHGPEHAQVNFRQRYESDAFTDSVRKTLMMKRTGSEWKIVEETLR